MADKACIFCQIRDRELPGSLVYDGSEVMAFLDSRPLFLGHVLVVPKAHHRTLMDLPTAELPRLMEVVQRLSVAVKAAVGADGIFVASNNGVSQSVDHLHIHVVPRRKKDGLRGFMWPRLRYESDEAMNETATSIAAALGEQQ